MRRGLVAGALVLVGAWVALVGVRLFSAYDHLRDGVRAVERARRLSPDQLASGPALAEARLARARFAAARRATSGPLLAPVRVLPVVGRQLRSVSALAAAAEQVSAIGVGVLEEVDRVAADPPASGGERVAALRRLADSAGEAERRLAGIDLGPERALVPPLAARRAEFAAELADLRSNLARAATGAGGVADLLAGPTRYLLLAANNAEMRAGSGMFLSVGTLETAGGELTLGTMASSAALALPGQGVPFEGDLADRWGWLHPNREWRNLGVSPRFDVTAPLAARMWRARTGQEVDGVLALDVVALQHLLAATGPVTAGEVVVDAGGVLEELLHRQYLRFRDDPFNPARREQLADVAAAAFSALQAGPSDLGRLAHELSRAARGRHLLAWSADPAEQRAWEAMDVTGSLGSESLLIAVLNRGGNKLDQFLDVRARLDLDDDQDGEAAGGGEGDGGTAALLRLELTNRAPVGEPTYVAGPDPRSGVGEGVYLGLVSANLPQAAGRVEVEGASPVAVAGPDGPTLVVAVPVTVPRGEEVEVTIRFRLPEDGWLRVEPSARFPAVRWAASGRHWEDHGARLVRW